MYREREGWTEEPATHKHGHRHTDTKLLCLKVERLHFLLPPPPVLLLLNVSLWQHDINIRYWTHARHSSSMSAACSCVTGVVAKSCTLSLLCNTGNTQMRRHTHTWHPCTHTHTGRVYDVKDRADASVWDWLVMSDDAKMEIWEKYREMPEPHGKAEKGKKHCCPDTTQLETTSDYFKASSW